MLDTVTKYIQSGLSVIPVHPVYKTPRIESWTAFQNDRPTTEQVKKWFGNGHDYSPAIITGPVSGNLEILDFDDNARQYQVWHDLVQEQLPGIHKKLVQQTTQNGGIHIAYRCQEIDIPGNQKLSHGAIPVDGPGEYQHGGKGHKAIQYRGKWVIVPVLIETRGAGGYFLAAPGKGYELVVGSFFEIPIITAHERQILFDCAEILSEYVKEAPPQKVCQQNDGERPGDVFNSRVTIQELIKHDGWRRANRTKTLPDGTVAEMWVRPGKERGPSATVYDNKIHVFTSNAPPLEPRETYDPFSYFATTIHYGDFRAAAQSLVKQGYSVSESKQSKQGKQREATVSESKREVSETEVAPPLSYLIKEFVEAYTGTFHVSEIDREFGLISRAEKNNRAKILNKLASDLKIKKIPGKVGTWKTIDGTIKTMKLGSTPTPALDIDLPLGLSDLACILPGNIILVAGAPNGGKTAFLLTALYNILKKTKGSNKRANVTNNGNCSGAFESAATVSRIAGAGIRYCNSEMDEMELTDRCASFENGLEVFGNGVDFVQRYRDFADVIVPDGINFIDFLEIHEDFFELGKLINEIFENLNNGICFIACQKKQGADYAKGGAASLEKPRLVINLDRNEGYGKICKIVKCKKTVKKGDNHDGKECDFDINGDMQFVRYSPWRYVNEKQRKLYNRDYEAKGMEPIPEKNYIYTFRLQDGTIGRLLEHNVEQWEKTFQGHDVRGELERMQDDSMRKPFLGKGWFYAIPRLLEKRFAARN